MYVIQNYRGGTTAVHSRIQHSIADGWALVRLVLSLCDDSETVDRPTTIDKPRRRKRDLVGKATAPVVDIVRSPIDFVQETLSVALHPKRFIEFGTDVLGVAGDTTEASKNAVEFLFAPRPGKTILHGEVSGEKKVDWIEPVDLQPIKDIGRATETTINDVLLAVLTNALRKYLVDNDGLTVDDLFTAVPVSLRRPDADLPRTLGNRFGLIPVLLPVSIEDPVEQLQEIHRRVEDLKDSQMPIVSFGLISVSSLVTPDLERALQQSHPGAFDRCHHKRPRTAASDLRRGREGPRQLGNGRIERQHEPVFRDLQPERAAQLLGALRYRDHRRPRTNPGPLPRVHRRTARTGPR